MSVQAQPATHRHADRPSTVRVSQWRVKDAHGEPMPMGALANVVAQFNKLMRPPRSADDFRPTRQAAIASLHLLSKSMSPDTMAPTLVPRFGGGIQMEWHHGGVDLEISVDADGTVSAWCEHASGREWEDEGSINLQRLTKELSLLTRDV